MTLSVTTDHDGPVSVVRATGEIDVASAAGLRDALDALITAGRHRIALDLSEVTFIDSTGLGVLVGRLKVVRRQGGALTLAVTHARVLRVFEITGLDKVFALHPTLHAAHAAAQGEQE